MSIKPDTGILRRRRLGLLSLLVLTADPGEMSLAIRAAGLASRELVNRRKRMSDDVDMQLIVDMVIQAVPLERRQELLDAITGAVISMVEEFGLVCGGSIDLAPASQEEDDDSKANP